MVDYFWTDPQQAQERLNSTVMLYDGKPVFIERVDREPIGPLPLPRGDDFVPPPPQHQPNDKAIVRCTTFPEGKAEKIPLDDPLWNRFQDIPPLGWVNIASQKTAILAERVPLRNRQHGLSRNNLRFRDMNFSINEVQIGRVGGGLGLSSFFGDVGYMEALSGQWPNLPMVLGVIQTESVIAVSFKFAVSRDENGLRWLFWGKTPAGIFTDCNSLLLLSKRAYLREEIEESLEIMDHINNITEY